MPILERKPVTHSRKVQVQGGAVLEDVFEADGRYHVKPGHPQRCISGAD
jgi:hypothetical protein